MTETPIKTVEEQIVQHLKDNGQMLKWLAGKIGISPSHLFCVLKGEDRQKRDLTPSNLEKINEVLRTNFKNE